MHRFGMLFVVGENRASLYLTFQIHGFNYLLGNGWLGKSPSGREVRTKYRYYTLFKLPRIKYLSITSRVCQPPSFT